MPPKIPKKRRKITLEYVQKLAVSRSGECLSKKYVNAKTKMKFRCFNGHVFEAPICNVDNKGTWCSQCNINISEEITRIIFRELFGAEFIKVRPNWLNGLELDGYNDEMKLAFEYDGMQHHEFVKRFHKNREGFLNRQRLDKKKDKLCADNDVTLIRIPYTVKNSGIIDFVKSKCEDNNILIVNNNIFFDDLSFQEIYRYTQHKYEELIITAKNIGLELLSNGYLSSNDKIKVKCKHNHESTFAAYKLKHYDDCPKCSRYNGIDDIKRKSKDHGCVCLSTEYIDYSTKLEFKCDVGHSFMLTMKMISYLKDRPWCKNCRTHANKDSKAKQSKKALLYEEICQIAKDKGGICTDSNYVNRSTKMNFVCAKGHNITITPTALKYSGSWCHSCKTGKRTIEEMKKIAEQYEGECISDKYINLVTELTWKCKTGHTFMRKPCYIIQKGIFYKECKT